MIDTRARRLRYHRSRRARRCPITTLIAGPTQEDHASEPLSVDELGVNRAIVRDIALKTLFYDGRASRPQLARALKLSIPAVDDVVHTLTRDGLAAPYVGETTDGQAYALTALGYARAEEALRRNSYVGPVPVPLSAYVAQVRKQGTGDARLVRNDVARALSALVLPEATVQRIAWAAESRKPLLIHGASGNGKTTIAHILGGLLGGTIRIPYAIEMMGQIVRVFDESKHRAVAREDGGAEDDLRSRGDRRWVEVERPVIWCGGELNASSLELTYDADTRLYEAPLQLKANGGILIIDDLGRQQVPAVQLLNRWIVALESQVDHLTLHAGQMAEMRFGVVLVFATNLPPEHLADEAFLRRIRYKVRVENPTADEFRDIFRRECYARGVMCDERIVEDVLRRWYGDGRELRGCHARDILDGVADLLGAPAGARTSLTAALVDEACAAYFL